MTVGIEATGAYIPLYRLKKEEIARAWEGGSSSGEKSVANFDEDSITMAVAAAYDCLHSISVDTVDGCYFATNTSPYSEKQGAAVIAMALNMKREIAAIDFTESVRSGTMALKAAFDAVNAGSAKRILVVASDCRLGAPGSEFEQACGDGAVAVLIGSSEPKATMTAYYTHSDEIMDVWRTTKDTYLLSSEDRFVFTQGYSANMHEAIGKLLERQKATMKDFTKVCMYGPDNRRHRELAKELNLDYKKQVESVPLEQIGNTGAAMALMMLTASLENAGPGEKFLVANYGNGCDAFIFETTKKVDKIAGKLGIKKHVESKRYLSSYEKYMTYRQIASAEARKRPFLLSSTTILWRDRKWVLGCLASKCKKCGRLFFPPQRICYYCRSKDEFEYVSLAQKQGTLFSYNLDNLALTPDTPEVFGIAHFDDVKVRVFGRMTDRDPANISMGMPVKMTFRRIHDAGGYPNYFWKFMPLR